MDDRNREHAADTPFFSALVTPHRSLGRKGFALLMAFIATVCFSVGLMFWLIGAWPVAGFLGLDVLAIWLAFSLHYRAARAYEEIEISHTAVHVRKVSARGRVSEYHFNPRWLRLSVERRENEGCIRLSLAERGIELVLAAFLNPADRDSFARAVADALSTARSGYLPSPIRS